mgnify:CR=1 FL=1
MKTLFEKLTPEAIEAINAIEKVDRTNIIENLSKTSNWTSLDYYTAFHLYHYKVIKTMQPFDLDKIFLY